MSNPDQVLVLARLAQARSIENSFTPGDIRELFLNGSLPAPSRLDNVMTALRSRGLAIPGAQRGQWKLTPLGRQRSQDLVSDMDLGALAAEAATGGPILGTALHTVVPPVLAPPALLPGLKRFLTEHPFETNVFGMTRFPDDNSGGGEPDPVQPALEIAREACSLHGLEFHLASDRAIEDDLWTNVAAHMWASRYGVAFFEDRRSRGMNYNLTIEVGGMLVTGRRCALLKDNSIARMPTDLVGRIYKDVDLDKTATVGDALHGWIRDDLGLGPCSKCSTR